MIYICLKKSLHQTSLDFSLVQKSAERHLARGETSNETVLFKDLPTILCT